MGERAAGPMAKRMTSPQFGAVAPETGRPKMATEPLPASAVPTTQGAARTRATTTASHRHHEDAPRRLACARRGREPEHPGHRGDEDHGDDGRREARRGGDDGTEDDDLAHGPAAPVRSRARPRTGATPAARARRSAMKGKAA